jgi:hypothetical protein
MYRKGSIRAVIRVGECIHVSTLHYYISYTLSMHLRTTSSGGEPLILAPAAFCSEYLASSGLLIWFRLTFKFPSYILLLLSCLPVPRWRCRHWREG